MKVESLQKALFDAAVDGIITIDKLGIIASFNNAAERLFGYKKEEVLGKNVKLLMPLSHSVNHDSYLANYNDGGDAQIIGKGRDVEGQRKNGTTFPMRLSVGEAKDKTGSMFIGICHDLTDYKDTLNKLAKTEQMYKSIVDCQGQIVCRINGDYKVTFANRSFQKLFREDNTSVTGKYFIDLIKTGKDMVKSALDKVLSSPLESQLNFKTTMLCPSGYVHIEWWFSRVNNEFGVDEIQGFGIDISKEEAATQKAEYFKAYEPLTGLLNIDSFCATLESRVVHNKYSIFYLSINHYNLINNRYGFETGNKILIEASQRLKKCLKQPAILCLPSYGEFIVAIQIKELSLVNDMASSLLACLGGIYFIENEQIRINAKVGISTYPEDSAIISKAIRKAKSVLPKAKQNKNNIAFYDKKYYSFLQRQLDVEQRLLIALEDNLLQVFLQPKVNLITRGIVGYEALLRWDDPVLGTVSPFEFIKVAESMALATRIDRYVLNSVFESIRRCLDLKLDILPIAVNITSSHFSDPSLVEYILSQSEIFNVDLSYLDLEVTEGVLLEMNEQVERNLEILRARSMKISIDDFGTGYSSLSYIRKFSVDALKIDKSFVDDITDDVGKQLIAAVIAIAKAVNLDVIAEGIETDEQLQILLELGCKIGQGYLFAKPKYICDVLSTQVNNFK